MAVRKKPRRKPRSRSHPQPAKGAPAGSGEPEIIRRILARTDSEGRSPEWTHIKMITAGAPIDPLTMLLLHPNAASHPMGQLFRAKTYGRILAAIDQQTAQLRSVTLTDTRQNLDRLESLRWYVYRALIDEPELANQRRLFQIIIQLVPISPENTQALPHPPPPTPVRVQVWSIPQSEEEASAFLDEQVIHSGENFARQFSQAVASLLEAHCDVARLMRLRFRSPWWTKRPRPEAFPVVTKWLIPLLYDYLKPFYEVREYTLSDRMQGPGAFPRELMKDLAAILRVERPDLCGRLTWVQVLSAANRHVDQADPNRPMGKKMFLVATNLKSEQAVELVLALARQERGGKS